MLVLHPEQNITTRPIAHFFREILAQIAQALTLARLFLGRQPGFPRPPPLTVTPIRLTAPLPPLLAGPVIPTRLYSTPAQPRSTALQAAIMRPWMTRNEPTSTTLQQTATSITPWLRLLPDSAELMK